MMLYHDINTECSSCIQYTLCEEPEDTIRDMAYWFHAKSSY